MPAEIQSLFTTLFDLMLKCSGGLAVISLMSAAILAFFRPSEARIRVQQTLGGIFQVVLAAFLIAMLLKVLVPIAKPNHWFNEILKGNVYNEQSIPASNQQDQ